MSDAKCQVDGFRALQPDDTTQRRLCGCHHPDRFDRAAGSNNGFQTAEWPAHFPTVLAVGSDPDGRDGLFLNPTGLVEFATRGEETAALWPGGGSRRLVGSSFAAPRVAALLARLLSVHSGPHPLLAKALLRTLAERA